MPRDQAVSVVRDGPGDVSSALNRIADPLQSRGAQWSPSMYLWHLVDVIRIGAERLLALQLDPSNGIPCWDEKLLAEARRYERLSPIVGLAVLGEAVDRWLEIERGTSATVTVAHPLYGDLSALDLARRNAHEICHHTWDISRLR